MKILILVFVLIIPTFSFADTPTFNNLTDQNVESVAEDFSTLFVHTTVAPPRSLGKIFGIEAAVIAGLAEIPGIESLSKQADPSSDISLAPFAWLYGAVSVPFGITVEANLLPEMEVGDIDLQHYSLGAKWSITDVLLTDVLPFDLAVRASYSTSGIEYTQRLGGNSVNVNFDNNMFGLDALAGLDLLVVEPYVGLGMVNSDSDLEAFAPGFPAVSIFADGSRSKSKSVSSARIIAGCQFNLALLKLGLEYNHVFDNSRYAAKVGFAF